ncbi:MAG: AAA family ATPase [Bacteroidota bacterium]
MKPYPIGIQDFEKLRKEGYLYVDKTRQMYNLISSGSYFFLSRPRRFGKSLLLSTLKYIFQGKKALFEGLWIEDTPYKWEVHPVVHISFGSLGFQDVGLKAALEAEIEKIANQHSITLTEQGLARKFRSLIEQLGSGTQKLVLLIDEYDKPMVDYLEKPEVVAENQRAIKSFFSVIKDSDPYLAFFMLTGVSRFSKVSLFSDLNNLHDITFHPEYASIGGYTPEELIHYFETAISQVAQIHNTTQSALLRNIQTWYNGYQSQQGNPVYNPFSILSFFSSGRFANYWWETGTPTFLLKLLRKQLVYDFEDLTVGFEVFDNYMLENMDWRSLLLQTGYLTLKSEDFKTNTVILTYPNREVEISLTSHLLAYYRNADREESQALFRQIQDALFYRDLQKFIELINVLFASIPYNLFEEKRERFFHAILHLTFRGMGILTQSEVSTSKGRVDCVVHTPEVMYVMEFKLDAPAKVALRQIQEKQYGAPFLEGGKKVLAVGICFLSQKKAVAEWKAEPYKDMIS